MALRRIKDLFKVKNGQFINKNLSKIEQMERFRALREHEWDQLIGKIHKLIHHSPFNFKVYLDVTNPDLTIMMRIYEPGKDPVDPEIHDSIAHIYKPKEEDLDEKESS